MSDTNTCLLYSSAGSQQHRLHMKWAAAMTSHRVQSDIMGASDFAHIQTLCLARGRLHAVHPRIRHTALSESECSIVRATGRRQLTYVLSWSVLNRLPM